MGSISIPEAKLDDRAIDELKAEKPGLKIYTKP